MSEVCHDVKVEPVLKPIIGEALSYKTAISENDACLDIRASGFLGGWHYCNRIFGCTILTFSYCNWIVMYVNNEKNLETWENF